MKIIRFRKDGYDYFYHSGVTDLERFEMALEDYILKDFVNDFYDGGFIQNADYEDSLVLLKEEFDALFSASFTLKRFEDALEAYILRRYGMACKEHAYSKRDLDAVKKTLDSKKSKNLRAGEVLIESINKHDDLLKYANYKLTRLEEALEAYVLKKVEIDMKKMTMKINDYTYGKSDLDTVEAEMTALHKLFLESGDADILPEAIADSLNRLLVRVGAYGVLEQPQWYYMLLEGIIPKLFCESNALKQFLSEYDVEERKEAFLQRHYNALQGMLPPLESENPVLAYMKEMADDEPPGFMAALKRDQAIIREMLYLLLSANGPCKNASPAQRSWIFSKHFKDRKQDWMTATKSFTFYNLPGGETVPAKYTAAAVRSFSDGADIPEEIRDGLNRAKKDAAKAVKDEVYEEYEGINDLHQILFLEILGMIGKKPGFKFQMCKNKACGRFFSPAESLKTKYCSDTCRELAKKESRLKYAGNMKEIPAALMYRTAQGTYLRYIERLVKEGVISGETANKKRKDWGRAANMRLDEVLKTSETVKETALKSFSEWLECEQKKLRGWAKQLRRAVM